jgi:hypothetical protein
MANAGNNAGTIQAVHGNSLIIAGRMENVSTGVIDVAGGTFGLAGKSAVAIYLGDNNYVLSTSPSINDASLPPLK